MELNANAETAIKWRLVLRRTRGQRVYPADPDAQQSGSVARYDHGFFLRRRAARIFGRTTGWERSPTAKRESYQHALSVVGEPTVEDDDSAAYLISQVSD